MNNNVMIIVCLLVFLTVCNLDDEKPISPVLPPLRKKNKDGSLVFSFFLVFFFSGIIFVL